MSVSNALETQDIHSSTEDRVSPESKQGLQSNDSPVISAAKSAAAGCTRLMRIIQPMLDDTPFATPVNILLAIADVAEVGLVLT